MEILKINNETSEGICKCTRYKKQITKLQKVLKDEAEESVSQYLQQERRISKLTYERLFAYRLLKDSKVEIERLKAEPSSRSQNKKKALEEVGSQNSNANLSAPNSLNLEVREK